MTLSHMKMSLSTLLHHQSSHQWNLLDHKNTSVSFHNLCIHSREFLGQTQWKFQFLFEYVYVVLSAIRGFIINLLCPVYLNFSARMRIECLQLFTNTCWVFFSSCSYSLYLFQSQRECITELSNNAIHTHWRCFNQTGFIANIYIFLCLYLYIIRLLLFH